ncbi:MAG: hypothetical protein KJ741_05670 [Proteobacteria bacterium]|nr:hypothetical protein [Pseudomonadota bacterium]
MGKKSLIQSTSKKKKTGDKETVEEKPVVKAKAPAKTTPDKKTSQKVKPAEKEKEASPPKKITLKELIFKKFESLDKGRGIAEPVAGKTYANYVSPPFFTGKSSEEIEKIQTILFRKFSMADVIAAAEKAAAEKAAAEKAAAEKAAAEKAAAEKAAAEKAASAQKKAPTPAPKKNPDPQEKVMKIALGAFVLVILYLVMVSYSNMNTFHLKAKGNNAELWQGKFSPNGENKLMVLPGAQLPEGIKSAGSREDIFPFVAKYFLNQADRFYNVPGIPDFNSIESSLSRAKAYAVTPELEKEVLARLTAIDFTVLLNKAEIAIKNGTPENLEAALSYLSDAKRLDLDEAKIQLIDSKLDGVKSMIAKMNPEEEPPSLEPETMDDKSTH